MDKVLKKILVVLLLILLTSTVAINANNVYAEGEDGYQAALKTALNNTEKDQETGASNAARNITAAIISSVRIIGVCIAVTMLLVLAMKYMSAAPGEKADIKKSAIVYVVGAVVLFAVVGILGIIEQFAGIIS